MIRKLVIAAVFALSAPAGAVTIVPGKCVSVSDPAGCFYLGNIGNAGDAAAAQAQYNALRNPDITLNFLGKSDSGFGTLIYGDSTNTFGTWSAPGFTIDYLGVKAGPEFIIYKVSNNQWSTNGLVNQRNIRRQLSHLTFFGSRTAVPEPATWALMIGGFGAIGATMRRRRARTALA